MAWDKKLGWVRTYKVECDSYDLASWFFMEFKRQRRELLVMAPTLTAALETMTRIPFDRLQIYAEYKFRITCVGSGEFKEWTYNNGWGSPTVNTFTT